MPRILIIDDDPEICETMESLFTRLAHHCHIAHNLADGMAFLDANGCDLVFLDVRLPDGNGLDYLERIMKLPDSPEVIILTGKGDPDGAELAIKGGAWDYLLKPSSIREISLTLGRALKYREQKQGKTSDKELDLSSVVGDSPGIRESFERLGRAARSDSNVLITGETGTGKELFAATIHANSRRQDKEFVVVDCAGLTETLVGSTLFGHKKGAFTGAQADRIGLIKLADKGTLFLDEVGEMPLSVQKSFLRVLQERTFRAVGDEKEQTSDFRLMAATNQDLDDMVEKGEFRADLLFRIKTMHLHLPPLTQRQDDIRLLAKARVKKLCEREGIAPKAFSPDFFEMLEQYNWPGNVRELFNILEQAVMAAEGEKKLYPIHLPRTLRIQVAKLQIKSLTHQPDPEPQAPEEEKDVRKIGHDIFEGIFDKELPSLKDFKAVTERIYLEELIRQCHGKPPRILSISKLSRSHFYSLLKKHDLNL